MSGVRDGEEMQGGTALGGGALGTEHIVAIRFVDGDTVGHLHDAPFDPLQFVAGAADQNQQEKVNHRVHGCF